MKAQVAGSAITRVVITRSKRGNAELANELRARGYEPVPIDTIEFLPPEDWSTVDSNLRRLRDFDWVIFTSATGAEFFVLRMRSLSLALPWLGKPAVAAVGEKTGSALQREGMKVDFVPSAYLTKALAEELPKSRGRDLIVLRADIGDPGFVPALERGGFKVSDVAIYRTSQVSGTEEKESAVSEADAIVFASPSAVEAFVGRFGGPGKDSGLTGALALCIGPTTAAAARVHGFTRIVTPETHTVDGILECLRRASSEAEGS